MSLSDGLEFLLTETQLAEQLGCSTRTLQADRQKGAGIPFVKLGDSPQSLVRYRPSKVLEYLANKERVSTSQEAA